MALLRPTPLLARVLGMAGLVAAVPHLAYHLVHVSLVPGHGDQLAQTLALLGSALLPAAILLGAGRLADHATASEPTALRPASDRTIGRALAHPSAVAEWSRRRSSTIRPRRERRRTRPERPVAERKEATRWSNDQTATRARRHATSRSTTGIRPTKG